MRYVAAYLLAVLGGNPTPKVPDIEKVIGSVGIECDEKRIQQVIDACKGKSVNELIAEGMKKIDNLGSVVATDATTTTTENPTEGAVAVEKPQVQKQKESSPETSDDEGGFTGLFD